MFPDAEHSITRSAINAANAQKSTGPRTAQGKERSSRNALKHGLTARELIVAPEEADDFAELRAELQDELQPSTLIEQILFNQLLHAAWNLRRIRSLEVQMAGGKDPLLDAWAGDRMDRLARYATRYERSFYRALKELRVVQTNRLLRQATGVDPEESAPLAEIKEITKRTQAKPVSGTLSSLLDPESAPEDAPRVPKRLLRLLR